jgi:hypothetical protein
VTEFRLRERPVRVHTKDDKYWWPRAILASTTLGSGAKILLVVLLDLDIVKPGQPGGCFLSEVGLASRIGRSAREVRRLRQCLLQDGVVQRVGQTSASRWFVLLPLMPLPVKRMAAGEVNGLLTGMTAALDALVQAARRIALSQRSARQHHTEPTSLATPDEDSRSREKQARPKSPDESVQNSGRVGPTLRTKTAEDSGRVRPKHSGRVQPELKKEVQAAQASASAKMCNDASLAVHAVHHLATHSESRSDSPAPDGRGAPFGREVFSKEGGTSGIPTILPGMPRATAGIPRSGEAPRSAEPGEVEGWYEYKKAVIALHEGVPVWWNEGAERSAYCRERLWGSSHSDLLFRAGTNLDSGLADDKVAS